LNRIRGIKVIPINKVEDIVRNIGLDCFLRILRITGKKIEAQYVISIRISPLILKN